MKTSSMNIFKPAIVCTCLLLAAGLAQARKQQSGGKRQLPYMDSSLSVERRVNDLIARMTIQEKIGQLQSDIRDIALKPIPAATGLGGLGPVLRNLGPGDAAKKANEIQRQSIEHTRLGIPLMLHDEGLHGLIGKGATSFPQAIALASTFDPDLVGRVASAIGKETRTRGIRQLLSPVINIARDVRWGRVEETYGEDPYLTTRMGVAFCKGVEREGVVTTPKHFAANVGDGGRDSYPIHFSERLLREIYFPAFKACIQEGHAGSVMAAYNALDGLPCSSNPWLLGDILRKEWGFTGYVVSDYGSVSGIVDMHHTAADEKEAAVQALTAGLDVELPGIEVYGKPLLDDVQAGNISQKILDRSVRRVLGAKFRLGLFDHPYVDPQEAEGVNHAAEHQSLALQAAREGIVLLKNEKNLLPLKSTLASIAVIGPAADHARLGGYSAPGVHAVSVAEGLRAVAPRAIAIRTAMGTELRGNQLPAITADFLKPADTTKGTRGLLGEYFSNMKLEGTPSLVRVDPKVDFDWGGDAPSPAVPADHFSARWSGKLVAPLTRDYRLAVTSDDGVRLFLDGELVVNSWFDRGPATDNVTVHLVAGRQYDVKMEYYENEGGAVAALGWDYRTDVDTMMQNAVALARTSDVAVVVVGILEGEGSDRSSLDLPGAQEELIRNVAATGTPTVVVLTGGSAVTMSSWLPKVGGVLETWYGGENGGTAAAEILLGLQNPSGRLPITFPQSVGQVPLYYNHKPTGRGNDYVDLTGAPLFPFGFGLSYTKFEYGNLRIDSQQVGRHALRIRADVKNAGQTAGDEVAQLYLHDAYASVTRPVEELKGFRRVSLKPGEVTTVEFDLGPDDLSFYNYAMKFVVEPRIVDVRVGSSSDDIRLQQFVTIPK